MKIVLKNIARKLFESAAVRLESDHKHPFRILAKLVMRYRYLMGGAILANLGSALNPLESSKKSLQLIFGTFILME